MKVHSRRPSRARQQPRKGHTDGYRHGWNTGMRDGACKALLQHTSPPALTRYPLRVLYVPQGFESIDSGIIGALQEMVNELHVVQDLHQTQALAEQLRPDLVVVLNGLHVFPANHPEQIDAIRAMGIKTLIWFVDDPYSSEQSSRIAPHYDVVLTHELGAVEPYRELCSGQVHYMPLGANTSWFRPSPVEQEYSSDICFIGQGFWNRIALFDELAPQLAARQVVICGGLWDRLQHYSLYGKAIRPGWMPVSETIRYYSSAKIVINQHRTTEPGSDNHNTRHWPGLSINPRTFEIAACGTLQMVDWREDLTRYYEPGVDIETFTSASELKEKIAYYLEHEDARRAIALRGLKRTLRQHTYASRVQQMLQLITN